MQDVTTVTGAQPAPNQVNLADDARYANKLAEMEALLLAEMRRLDDPYRHWNQPDDGLQPSNRRDRSVEDKKKKTRRARGEDNIPD